jgi:glycosyltransferase involved in cell wall biosynthesis
MNREGAKGTVTVLVSDDLMTDQRVQRTCKALKDNGYGVVLVGRDYPSKEEFKADYKVKKMHLVFKRSALFYGELNIRQMWYLLAHKTDIVYANDMDTLLGAYIAAKIKGLPLVFDAHELFSEVPELEGRERVKRFWQWLERKLIPKTTAAITVCQSVADHYEKICGVKMKVVRNVPDTGTYTDLHPAGTWGILDKIEGKDILLYQGAVNKGRGLREIIDAMEFLEGCVLVIVGGGDMELLLKPYANHKPYGERIVFTGRKTPEELHRITPKATLGLCLMENIGLNYYYSLPNRLSDFAVAGVPVIASKFPEIERFQERYGTCTLVEEKTMKDPKGLAVEIEKALEYWKSMTQEERSVRFALAKKELRWEEEQKKLISVLDAIKSKKRR